MYKYIKGLRFVAKGHFSAKGLRFVAKRHFSAKGLHSWVVNILKGHF